MLETQGGNCYRKPVWWIKIWWYDAMKGHMLKEKLIYTKIEGGYNICRQQFFCVSSLV